jgi:thiamine pyrophosphokinase
MNNKIYIRKGMITFDRKSLFGKYISILPYSADALVSEIKGFKYNADNLQLIRESGRGISNELLEESGYIKTDDYIIIMETKD